MVLPQWEVVLRLVVAAALGSLIGLERERLVWAAGLRTHMLVCVGAALMMIVSAYGFAPTLGDHVVLDPSRVAAQVVSGIGFLGAGSIILRNEAVKGLTTAASVWAVAGIGLAAGAGLYTAAVSATLIILLILAGLKPVEERLKASRTALRLTIHCADGALSPNQLRDVLGGHAGRIRELVIGRGAEDGQDEVALLLSTSPRETDRIIALLKNLPGVHQVDRAG